MKLTITGITKKQAKDAAEEISMGSMMWSIEPDGVVRAYISENSVCSIEEETHKVTNEGEGK
jgi:hypothetical protein